MSDVAFIYPITPSTPGNELSDQLATEGRRNLHGNIMQVGSVNRLLTRPLGSCKLQAPKGWQSSNGVRGGWLRHKDFCLEGLFPAMHG